MIGKFCIIGIMTCAIAPGQASTAATKDALSNPVSFDVASIRPSQPGPPSSTWGILPDGYRAHNQTIRSTVMIAYFPQGLASWAPERLKGAPAWLDSDQYDITAKVAVPDLPKWQKQGATLEHEDMFRAMLQSLLAERCKLLVHLIPTEIPGLVLAVGKHGPQFKPTPADETIPAGGMPFSEGGTAINENDGHTVRFYGVTMERLAQYLSIFSYPRFPVQDQTGLTGKFDLVLRRPEDLSSASGQEDSNSTFAWDVDSIGLQLKPTKIPTQTLVIDHIEHPSEN